MKRMLNCLKLFHRLLTLSSFWGVLFSCCSDWLFFASLCSKSLIWFSALTTLLLFACKLFFVSVIVSFDSDWMFFYAAEVLTKFPEHPHNQCFELCIYDCLSPFCLVFFLEFWSILLFGPCFFVSSFWQPPCVCFYVLGRAAVAPSLGIMAKVVGIL